MRNDMLSQPIVDITDFESGMNGWEFKYWMPAGREISAKVVEGNGFRSRHFLQIDANGDDDDGIFYIQKKLKADIEGKWKQAVVSWALKVDGGITTFTWPRVIYVGAPQDLARRETQKKFNYFYGMDGLSTCPTCDNWYGHLYKTEFDPSLDDLQICIGWKINWETRRTVFLDNVIIQAR